MRNLSGLEIQRERAVSSLLPDVHCYVTLIPVSLRVEGEVPQHGGNWLTGFYGSRNRSRRLSASHLDTLGYHLDCRIGFQRVVCRLEPLRTKARDNVGCGGVAAVLKRKSD